MANFTYDALDAQGKLQRGSLAADSRAAALDALAGRGLSPVAIEGEEQAAAASGNGNRLWSASQRVPAAQVEAFTRELANLLAAGVPLSRGLSILQREATHPVAKARWTAIHDDVVSGKPLAEALARAGNSFPAVYVAMVRAGELGGFLDLVLNQIADFRWRESELKGRVKTAMVYPIVLACLAAAVLVFLMIFFIPTFSKIFEDFGAALPLLTRVIVAASRLSTRYGPLVVLAVIGIVLGVRRFLATDYGSRWFERFTLGLPGLGIVLARFALVRFARMLGTLLGAGVPLVTALRVAQEALGNQILADAVGQAIQDVKQGATLSRSLSSCKQLFPPSVIEMIAVAEESGRLDKELNRLAMVYESELDRRLRMLVALAEPALLFVMAALIGTIVVGMLLPIYTLQDMYK
ncbi:MAG: type II secretion system F family protein [Planctomycetota bacterium]|nr:type II secretion system F family protein [Planctomycetota bacterium]